MNSTIPLLNCGTPRSPFHPSNSEPSPGCSEHGSACGEGTRHGRAEQTDGTRDGGGCSAWPVHYPQVPYQPQHQIPHHRASVLLLPPQQLQMHLRTNSPQLCLHPPSPPLSPPFRDFEQAARAGYAQAWFRLGRDYENFNDALHARDCFERGLKLNVESCVYVGPSFRFFPSTFFPRICNSVWHT